MGDPQTQLQEDKDPMLILHSSYLDSRGDPHPDGDLGAGLCPPPPLPLGTDVLGTGRHVLGVTCLLSLCAMHKGRSLLALGYRGVNFIGRALKDPFEPVPVGWGGQRGCSEWGQPHSLPLWATFTLL